MSIRVAIYARVSTKDQDTELQIRECRAYVASQGWLLVEEYIDKGWSGAKASRPQLDRMMQDARRKKFNCVLTWKLDRLGRSVINCINLIKELEQQKIRFVALTQGIDTDRNNATSKFLLHILAALAEMERELIRERVVAGLEVAKAQGVTLGRAKGVYTSEELAVMREQGKVFEVGGRLAMARKNKPGQYLFLVNQDQVQEMKQKGLSLGAIAAQVGTSKSTVKRIISGEAA